MARRRLAVAACLFLSAAAPPVGVGVSGDFLTPDRDGVVRLQACGGATCGVIVGVVGQPLDVSGKPQCGYTLLRGLRPGEDGRLHGTVTNPEDGKTYDAQVWLGPDGAMRLRGFIGLPIFGSTQLWQPYAGTIGPGCRFTKH
jgi:uncharacterized protein (DUF2147 family)